MAGDFRIRQREGFSPSIFLLLFNTTFANLIHEGTEICLDYFRPAAHIVDVLRLDFVGVVHFAPVFSSSFE